MSQKPPVLSPGAFLLVSRVFAPIAKQRWDHMHRSANPGGVHLGISIGMAGYRARISWGVGRFEFVRDSAPPDSEG